MKQSAKGIKILLLISLCLILITSSFSFAESFVPQDIIKNTLYNDPNYFSSGDTQSFYVPTLANLSSIKVIGKANSDYITTQPIFYLYENNDTTNTTGTLITTKVSKNLINNNYFTQLTFDLTNINLTAGYYWFKLDTSGGQNFYYADTSPQDTYLKGGINNISSTNDVYFVISGVMSDVINVPVAAQKSPILNQMLGDDFKMFILAGIGIMIGGLLSIATFVKHDIFLLLASILICTLLYLIGILNFYITGYLIVADVVCFIYGGNNEGR